MSDITDSDIVGDEVKNLYENEIWCSCSEDKLMQVQNLPILYFTCLSHP